MDSRSSGLHVGTSAWVKTTLSVIEMSHMYQISPILGALLATVHAGESWTLNHDDSTSNSSNSSSSGGVA